MWLASKNDFPVTFLPTHHSSRRMQISDRACHIGLCNSPTCQQVSEKSRDTCYIHLDWRLVARLAKKSTWTASNPFAHATHRRKYRSTWFRIHGKTQSEYVAPIYAIRRDATRGRKVVRYILHTFRPSLGRKAGKVYMIPSHIPSHTPLIEESASSKWSRSCDILQVCQSNESMPLTTGRPGSREIHATYI